MHHIVKRQARSEEVTLSVTVHALPQLLYDDMITTQWSVQHQQAIDAFGPDSTCSSVYSSTRRTL